MSFRFLLVFFIWGFVIFLPSCNDDDEDQDLMAIQYRPEPYPIVLPKHFPPLNTNADNPLTKQGVQLGRHLFYDPILSGNLKRACASCHQPTTFFTDTLNKTALKFDQKYNARLTLSLKNSGRLKIGQEP